MSFYWCCEHFEKESNICVFVNILLGCETESDISMLVNICCIASALAESSLMFRVQTSHTLPVPNLGTGRVWTSGHETMGQSLHQS